MAKNLTEVFEEVYNNGDFVSMAGIFENPQPTKSSDYYF